MKIKQTAWTILFLCILTFSIHAHAADANMIFWYPGEAGSTTEAQPVLDIFFEYVNKRIAPAKLEGNYFNSVESGIKFIKSKKPILGIISYSAYVQNKDLFNNAKALLATITNNSGGKTERYSLVGMGTDCSAGIISSEPFSIEFTRNNLFPQLPADTTTKHVDQIIFELRKISEGTANSCAILTPTEAATLKRMSSPWAKKIKFISESEAVPTARLLLLSQSWDGTEKIKNTLIAMDKDEEGREILSELRLKGFINP
ncbi:MAG: hypothetical protein HN337_09130 [Deltaproteobacteria bacterium]|jgi:hypothetical protein|nr:hypothetical protein [Deltaproteobacteria bacterium]